MTAEAGPSLSSEQVQLAEQYRQRRATAVLCPVFGDIQDSTRLLEELGEEEYDAHRQAFDHSLRSVIERGAEGTLVQTYGDGFLAVFSEPSTAVERCLEIQQKLEGDPFRLRIGVDMGQVAVKRDAGIVAEVFGRHVNRAARIEALAEPGCVLTSFPVYDSAVGWLRKTVRWTHRAPTELKGFAEPVTLHEPALRVECEAARTHTRFASEGRSARPPEMARGGSWLLSTRGTRDGGADTADPRWMARVFGADPLDDPYEMALRSIRTALGGRKSRWFSKTRLLWVDDFPGNHRELTPILSRVGLRVEDVTDTSQALAALRRKKFAAVISDMGRGELATAGLELLDQMRAADIRLPLLIFTSPRAEMEYGRAALERGARICTSGTVSLLRSLAAALSAR